MDTGDVGDDEQDPRDEAGLRAAERRLQTAQRSGDVPALRVLLHERLLFTVPLDGDLHTRDDDLDVHTSGRQVMGQVVEEELHVAVVGATGVTWFLGRVAGTFDGDPFDTRLRYTRTWVHDGGRWRVLAAHASPVRDAAATSSPDVPVRGTPR